MTEDTYIANRNWPNNKLYQTAIYPSRLDVSITIGASGAVSSATGSYLKSVTKKADGMYEVRFQDNYARLIGLSSSMVAPVSGSPTTSGSFVTNTAYRIVTLGTTTQAQWETAGFPAGITAAPGMSFVAAAAGAGNGTADAIISPGIAQVVFMDNGAELNSSLVGMDQRGAILNIQTLGMSFAGSALAAHTHNFIVKGGQAASTTNNIANYAGPILGKQEATDATYLGSASATNGGVVTASAGTPAGSVSLAAANPASGTILKLSFLVDNSSTTIQS